MSTRDARSLPPERARILVLDDSEVARTVITRLLQSAGYPVMSVSNMEELERAWNELQPDVLLTDVNMPEARGDEVCTMLKRRLAGRLVPIILMSSMPEQELAALAERCGAEGYVSKQDGPHAILRGLQEVLSTIVF